MGKLPAIPNDATIKIHYQDESGKSIEGLNDTEIVGKVGTDYVIPTPEINNANFSNSSIPLRGIFSDNQSVIVTYNHYLIGYNIHYLDEQDNKIHDDIILLGDVRSQEFNAKVYEANISKISFDGKNYLQDPNKMRIKQAKNNFEVFLVYELKQ